MELYQRVYEDLVHRKERVESGLINCIPLPFPRFSQYFPGIEQARYYLITANQKVGKSKLSDFLFMYEPFFYAMEHPEKLRIKVIYFTLEMSKEEKYREFMCYLLYKLSNGSIRISPQDLKSTNADKPLDNEVLELLATEEYKRYFAKFEECIEFIDDIKNPTGINKYCRNYALTPDKGKLVMKEITVKEKDEITGVEREVQREVIDYYEPTDPDEYRIIICDNASNLTLESGMDLRKTIEKMSKYFVALRNQLNYTICLIQHQAQDQEGIENIKLNKLKPTAAGLADCKTTIRDINMAIGLYSPFKHEITEYGGYNITRLKNFSRFMEIIDDRDGGGGNICPLYFDGAVSVFRELPEANRQEEVARVYNKVERILNEGRVILLTTKGINKIDNVVEKIKKIIKNLWKSF